MITHGADKIINSNEEFVVRLFAVGVGYANWFPKADGQ
jgi:hypothetical protein